MNYIKSLLDAHIWRKRVAPMNIIKILKTRFTIKLQYYTWSKYCRFQKGFNSLWLKVGADHGCVKMEVTLDLLFFTVYFLFVFNRRIYR